MDQDNKQKDRYFVAVKVFLEKDQKLLILKDVYGQWDLPGGRIKKDEFDKPLEQVIKRKMEEELGTEVAYEVENTPRILMRHKRQEQVGDENEARIYALGYIGQFKSGEIKLSGAHEKMEWIDIASLKPEDYFTGGWLQGVKDYLRLRKL